MAGINLSKIRYAFTSVRVPLGTLPTKGKISNNDKYNDKNKNYGINSNLIPKTIKHRVGVR